MPCALFSQTSVPACRSHLVAVTTATAATSLGTGSPRGSTLSDERAVLCTRGTGGQRDTQARDEHRAANPNHCVLHAGSARRGGASAGSAGPGPVPGLDDPSRPVG